MTALAGAGHFLLSQGASLSAEAPSHPNRFAETVSAERPSGSSGRNDARVVWHYDFGASGLSLRSASNPEQGAWMPNDATWQNAAQGYEDFAATTCSSADVSSGICNMAGGTFDVNPDDPLMQGVNPFAVHDGALTISAFRTPAALNSAIKAELTSQGVLGPTPSFVGGRLTTNPNVFPGFTYGYFEFSASFPNAGPGMFPALWFYSTPGKASNPGKAHAEIDLLEFFGNADVFYTHVIEGNTRNADKSSKKEQAGQWHGAIDVKFHTYGMDWTAGHIDFYFDRLLIYSVSPSAAAWFRGVSLSPVMDYVIDAPWMTSNVKLQANSSTPDRLMMKVRYVRLYNRKPF